MACPLPFGTGFIYYAGITLIPNGFPAISRQRLRGFTRAGGSMHTNNAPPHFRNLVDNALTGILDNTLEGKILFVKQGVKRG